MVKLVWEKLELPDLRLQMWDMQSQKEMIEIIMVLGSDKKIPVCCMLWQWWSRSNKINANEKTKELNEVVSQIISGLLNRSSIIGRRKLPVILLVL
jgi:hypothetical protein